MKVCICGSMSFADKMLEVGASLERMGHDVFLPDITEKACYEDLTAEDVRRLKSGYMWRHIGQIENSNAILVLNYDKKGIEGYIGANTFLEMVVAMYRKMPIFLMNGMDKSLGSYEEIIGMNPVILMGDLEKIR